MSMLIGVGVFSANKDVAVTRDASALAVDIFMKRRRSIISATFLSFRAKSRNLLLLSTWKIRDVSTPLDVTNGEVNRMTRREAAKIIGTATASLMLPTDASRGQAKGESSAMLTRTIPSSGEKLPVIGLGTWRAFDVDLSADIRRQLEDVLSLFVKLGGRVIDSSPMYGRAEEVIGDLTSALGIREKLFLATKVWTKGKQSGIQSMERSMSLLRTNRIDLMQVHNLIDVNAQLATLQGWKQQGRIRYTGITHYESGALSEIQQSRARSRRRIKRVILKIICRAELDGYPIQNCAAGWRN